MVALSPAGSFSSVVMSKKLIPGFGKSGTLRIICLRSMVNMDSFGRWLFNRKPLEISRPILVRDDDMLPARAWRAPPQSAFDARDRLLLAFHERLDASVEQV